MLNLRDVTVSFGGLTAVKSVSLHVGSGEVVGLVGSNGAGKTTLFNAISGLVRLSSGQIMFESTDVVRKPMYRRARIGIGRTFQIPQPMHELTVRQNLLVAQRFGAGAVDPDKIESILDFMNLTHKADRDAATQLSLTELKALEVAKALATNARLLLLDEVLAGLETNGKRQFMGKLAGLHAKFGTSILIIEHDIETIRAICQRVFVLNHGELIAQGSPDEVFSNAEVIKSYTGGAHA
jgi:branched-chain amino acid transport system ATP-binding protein